MPTQRQVNKGTFMSAAGILVPVKRKGYADVGDHERYRGSLGRGLGEGVATRRTPFALGR